MCNESTIYGIGTDIVRISRIQRSVERFGNDYLRRVFTAKEIDYCYNKKLIYHHYAGRFAAKEAFIKSLQLRNSLKWTDVEIDVSDFGAPFIHLNGDTKKIVETRGIGEIFISLSHCSEYAIANVVLVRKAAKNSSIIKRFFLKLLGPIIRGIFDVQVRKNMKTMMRRRFG